MAKTRQQQAFEIAETNATMAADQKDSSDYDSPSHCYWSYSTNVEDTLREKGLIEFWLEASDRFADDWFTLTSIQIEYVHYCPNVDGE